MHCVMLKLDFLCFPNMTGLFLVLPFTQAVFVYWVVLCHLHLLKPYLIVKIQFKNVACFMALSLIPSVQGLVPIPKAGLLVF